MVLLSLKYHFFFCIIEPACWKALRENDEFFKKMNISKELLQDYHDPECDKDGYFSPWQCYSLGGCHCVDKYGKRISSSNREASLPDCGILANTVATRETKLSTTRRPTTQPATQRTTQLTSQTATQRTKRPTTEPASKRTIQPITPGKQILIYLFSYL